MASLWPCVQKVLHLQVFQEGPAPCACAPRQASMSVSHLKPEVDRHRPGAPPLYPARSLHGAPRDDSLGAQWSGSSGTQPNLSSPTRRLAQKSSLARRALCYSWATVSVFQLRKTLNPEVSVKDVVLDVALLTIQHHAVATAVRSVQRTN